MAAELSVCSAVLVAHDINLSIFKPVWLAREAVLSDDELSGPIVVTPALIRIPAERFELLILPDRIQVRPDKSSTHAQSDLLRILGGIVSKLPHTPYTAIGLNFEYSIHDDGNVEFAARNKERFATASSLDAIPEGQEDARFGAYFSFNALNMRLQVDVKPVRPVSDSPTEGSEPQTKSEFMLAKLNFNRDLSSPPSVPEILEVLGSWDAAASLAVQLASGAC